MKPGWDGVWERRSGEQRATLSAATPLGSRRWRCPSSTEFRQRDETEVWGTRPPDRGLTAVANAVDARTAILDRFV